MDMNNNQYTFKIQKELILDAMVN